MNHGLPADAVAALHAVFARHPAVEQAVLYGSRAKGTHKTGSDIDLTLLGEHLNHRVLGDLIDELDDLLLPYSIDLSLYAHLTHPDLRDHIQRVGQVLYQRVTPTVEAPAPAAPRAAGS